MSRRQSPRTPIRSRTAARRARRGSGSAPPRRSGPGSERRPQGRELLRQRMGEGAPAAPPAANGAAALASMNAWVWASEKPAAVSTRRMTRWRASAGGRAGGRSISAGSVVGSRSYPWCRATSSIRSSSRSTSTRADGDGGEPSVRRSRRARTRGPRGCARTSASGDGRAEHARDPRPGAAAPCTRRAGRRDSSRCGRARVVPAPMAPISAMARSRATGGALMSAPRSNRAAASVLRPSPPARPPHRDRAGSTRSRTRWRGCRPRPPTRRRP